NVGAGVSVYLALTTHGVPIPDGKRIKTTTNSRGEYIISNIPLGHYLANAHYDDGDDFCYEVYKEIDIVGGKAVSLDFRVEGPGGGEVHGYVLVGDESVQGAYVGLYSPKRFAQRTWTDEHGFFSFTQAPAGEMFIEAKVTPEESPVLFTRRLKKELICREGESLEVDFIFPQGTGGIAVNVMTGEIVRKAVARYMAVTSSEGEVFRTLMKDGTGKVENLGEGRYLVQAMIRSNRRMLEGYADVKDDEEVEVHLEYQVGSSSISGVVFSQWPSTSKWVTRAWVFKPGACPHREGRTLYYWGVEGLVAMSRATEKGSLPTFAFPELEPGTFDIIAAVAYDGVCKKLAVKTVTINAKEETRVEFDLTR
ncbi:collagen binding domain-containing protein, partial [Candidatus Hydrogenedentota bacterium]